MNVMIVVCVVWAVGVAGTLCLCRAARLGDEQMERLDAARRAAGDGDDGRPGKGER